MTIKDLLEEKAVFEEIGTIELTKGTLDVTDPCYHKDVWCRTTLTDVQPGKWKVTVANLVDEGRTAALIITHGDKTINGDYEEVDACIGVDAGLCGFFEEKPDYNDSENRDQWGEICDFIHSHNYKCIAGLDTPLGCVGACSDSGYGDGSYPLYIRKENDKIVSAAIIFIGKEEDYEPWFDDDDEEESEE